MFKMDWGDGSGGDASSKSARDASITLFCHPGRKMETSCFKVQEKQSEKCWCRSAQPLSAVTGGSLSHSKNPTKAAKHGEGCVFSRSQKSCQGRRRTRNVSERAKINQPHRLFCTDFGDDASIFKAIRPTTRKLAEQRHKAAVEDPNVNIRERSHLKTEGEGTHYRSLENYSTEMVRRFTATVFRMLSKGCTGRSASRQAFCRHCALDGTLGTHIPCSSDQALRGFPVTEQCSPQVTR